MFGVEVSYALKLVVGYWNSMAMLSDRTNYYYEDSDAFFYMFLIKSITVKIGKAKI